MEDDDESIDQSDSISSDDEIAFNTVEQSPIDEFENQDIKKNVMLGIETSSRPPVQYIYNDYTKESKKLRKDPFLRYGLGTKAYVHMQSMLIKLMCIVVLSVIPIIIIFAQDDGLSTIHETN